MILFQLAVLATPTVDAESCWSTIPRGLTADAGEDTGNGAAPRFRDLVAAFDALSFACTGRDAGTSAQHAIRDSVVDLVLHRSIRSPTACHRSYLADLCSCLLEDGKSALRFQVEAAGQAKPPHSRQACSRPVDRLCEHVRRRHTTRHIVVAVSVEQPGPAVNRLTPHGLRRRTLHHSVAQLFHQTQRIHLIVLLASWKRQQLRLEGLQLPHPARE